MQQPRGHSTYISCRVPRFDYKITEPQDSSAHGRQPLASCVIFHLDEEFKRGGACGISYILFDVFAIVFARLKLFLVLLTNKGYFLHKRVAFILSCELV